MRNERGIESALRYIDGHIARRIAAQELAELSRYSFYHFCHLFSSCTGQSVGAYLRHRRLELAAEDMLTGQSVAEVAVIRGFDTPSGFAKAFRKRYGMSPTEYKLMQSGITVTPEIKKMAAFTAVGYYLPPPEDLDILNSGAYWLGKDFTAVSKEDYQKLTYPGYAEIGAWMHPDRVTGDFYYFFGPITKDKSFVPVGMLAIDVPEAEYAAFLVPAGKDAKELNENVRKTWEYVFAERFDQSDYKFDEAKMDFEYYLGENNYVYVPVLKK